ncbi:MAG: hypothetical protein ACLGQU_03810 [Acidobacteriota bacterium]
MNQPSNELNLQDRLDLIQTMISEGRRSTEDLGPIFVLWGIAYYVAFAWYALGHTVWAWPITMLAAYVLTLLISSRRHGVQPRTTMGRATGSVWAAMAISMFILLPAIGISARTADLSVLLAIVATLLGLSNAASSFILEWKLQFACALLWWAVAVIACFATLRQSTIAFLVANFFCQIAFGAYGIFSEQRRKGMAAAHA